MFLEQKNPVGFGGNVLSEGLPCFHHDDLSPLENWKLIATSCTLKIHPACCQFIFSWFLTTETVSNPPMCTKAKSSDQYSNFK